MKFEIPEYPTVELTEDIITEIAGDNNRKYLRKIIANVYNAKYIRVRLAEAQNWKCCWCGCNTTGSYGLKHSATTEHVIPRSNGGTDDVDNLAMACSKCNHKRGTQEVDTFMDSFRIQGPILSKDSIRSRQAAARLRKYMKKLPKQPKVFDDWLETLRIKQEHRDILIAENTLLLEELNT